MTRNNEKDSLNAGANFIKKALDIGFNKCPKLVFTSS